MAAKPKSQSGTHPPKGASFPNVRANPEANPRGRAVAKGRPFEGSKADIREDKAQAKKRGMSMKAWEKSPADKRMDAQGFRRGGKVKRKK